MQYDSFWRYFQNTKVLFIRQEDLLYLKQLIHKEFLSKIKTKKNVSCLNINPEPKYHHISHFPIKSWNEKSVTPMTKREKRNKETSIYLLYSNPINLFQLFSHSLKSSSGNGTLTTELHHAYF